MNSKTNFDEFIVDEDQKYDARVIRVSGNLDNDTNETADEWNNRNRIS
jgi:hypothetical protein